jgi:two-component sensor histidine kinase
MDVPPDVSDQLNAALEQQETLTREMGHRVKNLFVIIDGMVKMSARASTSKDDMATSLSGRIHALANANALVRRSFNDGKRKPSSELAEILSAVLKPYALVATAVSGPSVRLGQQATNTIALIFHELATNAAKYGALAEERGKVAVDWTLDDGILDITWTETGGPALSGAPEKLGFGTTLVSNTVTQHGGRIAYDWQPSGVGVTITLPSSSIVA